MLDCALIIHSFKNVCVVCVSIHILTYAYLHTNTCVYLHTSSQSTWLHNVWQPNAVEKKLNTR